MKEGKNFHMNVKACTYKMCMDVSEYAQSRTSNDNNFIPTLHLSYYILSLYVLDDNNREYIFTYLSNITL